MSRINRWEIFGFLVLVGVFYAAYHYCLDIDTYLPPILRGPYDVRGGTWAGCPADGGVSRGRGVMDDAAIPEIGRRLAELFPPGTEEPRIEDYLRSNEFLIDGPCRSDGSVHSASFILDRPGFIISMKARSEVYWKVDGNDKVQWMKAYFRMDSL